MPFDEPETVGLGSGVIVGVLVVAVDPLLGFGDELAAAEWWDDEDPLP